MDDVASLAAFQQLHYTLTNKAAQGPAHGIIAKANIAGHPGYGKTKAGLPFQAGMPEKVGIDGPLRWGEMQARGQQVLELLPDKFGIGFFGFHDEILKRESRKQKAESAEKRKKKPTADSKGEQRLNPEKGKRGLFWSAAACRRFSFRLQIFEVTQNV